jgi:anthranilate phosphoribosyltransferase
MPQAKSGKPTSISPLSQSVAETFVHNADLWFATQAELLTDVDALTHAWLDRRREGVDAMRQALLRLTGCQDPGEMLHIHQEWLSGMFHRAAEDIAAFNTGIWSMTKKATTDLERAAREVTEPIQAVGAEALKAAATRPHSHKAAA